MIYPFSQRFIDILGSVFFIILFFPIMAITAIFIKIVSPNGAVFADIVERVGKDGKKFRMYKFRSMIPNAQDWLKSRPELYKKYQENSYKLDPDPRIIKGGAFIRKYSIDELPQFFNILLGDMSIVGPRAYFPFELNEQVERFPKAKDALKSALSVKPGLTGIWQISGRSKVDFLGRVEMDAKYAKRRSLLYDLMIILKTPFVVITGKGAV
ncbi:hypothetical protein A3H26_02750 [candidate division WWE3 bacterium RIFCSPLOWO2_12_FULL_36_10]|uniref:Bacterial sugar transferase domain-containing protein n=1 Tax=candidate division WWE3 bacterium RIFCSPLOWO2_12_FULL_36_10 TaxID=1802630 RepID=A0A1F4VGD6_UNCKA|nr:MAG: hypothetical protein A3H26_02750 [candidate division WWE3 bacterium RIFCSPLOWO2_12_FULL_36_10]